MGDNEDMIREAIRLKYGSIPKMSEATGIPATTIYHALERGLENTRTETSKKIKYYLFDWDKPNERDTLTETEAELVRIHRGLSPEKQNALLVIARALAL